MNAVAYKYIIIEETFVTLVYNVSEPLLNVNHTVELSNTLEWLKWSKCEQLFMIFISNIIVTTIKMRNLWIEAPQLATR